MMIYFLAGIAKSGKSFIAQDILTKYHMRVISTDWIMMMLHHGNKDIKIDIHQSDISVSKFLEPYIEGLIESLIHSKKDILIEGVHIQPEFSYHLKMKYPNQIKSIFLGYKDADPSLKASQLREHANLIENPWYMHMNDKELMHLVIYMISESNKLCESCRNYHENYIEVNDIHHDKDYIIKSLINK